MKFLPWILVAVGVGLIIYIGRNPDGPQHATGSDEIEEGAGTVSRWASKQRATGLGGNLLGKAKKGFGQATGNDDLAAEGAAEEFVGAVKGVVGHTAQAVGKTIHELNR